MIYYVLYYQNPHGFGIRGHAGFLSSTVVPALGASTWIYTGSCSNDFRGTSSSPVFGVMNDHHGCTEHVQVT